MNRFWVHINNEEEGQFASHGCWVRNFKNIRQWWNVFGEGGVKSGCNGACRQVAEANAIHATLDLVNLPSPNSANNIASINPIITPFPRRTTHLCPLKYGNLRARLIAHLSLIKNNVGEVCPLQHYQTVFEANVCCVPVSLVPAWVWLQEARVLETTLLHCNQQVQQIKFHVGKYWSHQCHQCTD